MVNASKTSTAWLGRSGAVLVFNGRISSVYSFNWADAILLLVNTQS